MKKLLLTCLLVIQASGLWATDLFDIQVFPLFGSQTVALAGIISSSSYKSTGTDLRAKISGLRSKWLASGSVIIESDKQKISADIKEGDFSGVINVSSLASFTISIYYDNQKLYQEHFNFPDNPDFLIVSDIDDTILVTDVANRAKMVYNSLFKKVSNRRPVSGTPELYQAMRQGETGMGKPYFIYLSSSPAFLSRSLKTFLTSNNFPPGTLVLKKSLISGDHASHKTGWLKKIRIRYPDKPLLLFGDSGEKDPLIYKSLVEDEKEPMLVRGIVIHEVTGSADTIKSLQQSRDELQKKFRVPLIFWSNIEQLKLNMLRDKLYKVAPKAEK